MKNRKKKKKHEKTHEKQKKKKKKNMKKPMKTRLLLAWRRLLTPFVSTRSLAPTGLQLPEEWFDDTGIHESDLGRFKAPAMFGSCERWGKAELLLVNFKLFFSKL